MEKWEYAMLRPINKDSGIQKIVNGIAVAYDGRPVQGYYHISAAPEFIIRSVNEFSQAGWGLAIVNDGKMNAYQDYYLRRRIQ
jgi:hypothetical protein